MEGEGEGEGTRRAGDVETARSTVPWERTGEEAAVLGVCARTDVRVCACRRPHTV